MKRQFTALLMQVALVVALAPALRAQNGAGKQPPLARKVPHATEIHGYKLKDDYFWLREKKNPEVIKYLEDENAYSDEVMKPTDLSVPSKEGDYYYYSRTEEGKQYPYMCRKKGSMQASEEILLDLNKM